MESIKKILRNKHILIIGKTETERKNFVNKIIKNANYETFRFPSKMKSFDDYYRSMKKMKLYKPWYEAKRYNENAIWDFHRDWISVNNSLLVLEEIQFMEERWKHEVIRLCIHQTENSKKGNDNIHLIISQEFESELIAKLANNDLLFVKENERRTKRQIIEQNLKVINISE